MSEDKWDADREARHNYGSEDLTPEEKIAIVARAKKMCESVSEEEWRRIASPARTGVAHLRR